MSVEGVDTFSAATGDVVSYGKTGIQAWSLDDDYDGTRLPRLPGLLPGQGRLGQAGEGAA